MTEEAAGFRATQREAGDGPPGATAAFPYDRMTVERFREAFPARAGATTSGPGSCRARGRSGA